MKTLPITIQLSRLAIESSTQYDSPADLLGKVEELLTQQSDLLGKFTGREHTTRRQLTADLDLHEYQFNCEKNSLHFELLNFRPLDEWQVKGFHFVW